ncbi:MAG: TlpA disulfide reductase family protein [Vicinamibacteria bacterium]
MSTFVFRHLMIGLVAVAALTVILPDSVHAREGSRTKRPSGGIVTKKAPKWEVESWSNLPKGKKKLDVRDFRGKVVYLYCFQARCPGCHSTGFPTLKKVKEAFKNDGNVAFVTMQTVFEGFHVNTKENGLATLRKFALDLPMAMSGSPEKRSTIMSWYRTRGTPWTVIIGPDGKVAWNGFHIRPEEAVALIRKLAPKSNRKR